MRPITEDFYTQRTQVDHPAATVSSSAPPSHHPYPRTPRVKEGPAMWAYD